LSANQQLHKWHSHPEVVAAATVEEEAVLEVVVVGIVVVAVVFPEVVDEVSLYFHLAQNCKIELSLFC
jgi:hypothetical protein